MAQARLFPAGEHCHPFLTPEEGGFDNREPEPPSTVLKSKQLED
jgi:hypothetical protein